MFKPKMNAVHHIKWSYKFTRLHKTARFVLINFMMDIMSQ